MNVYFIFMDLFYIKNIFLSIIVFNLFSFNSIYFILNKKKKKSCIQEVIYLFIKIDKIILYRSQVICKGYFNILYLT